MSARDEKEHYGTLSSRYAMATTIMNTQQICPPTYDQQKKKSGVYEGEEILSECVLVI